MASTAVDSNVDTTVACMRWGVHREEAARRGRGRARRDAGPPRSRPGQVCPTRRSRHDFALAAATYLIGNDVEPQILRGLSGDRGFPDVTMRAERASLRPVGRRTSSSRSRRSYGTAGEPFALDPRHLLRRVVAEWEGETGLSPTVAMELSSSSSSPTATAAGGRPMCPARGRTAPGPTLDPLGVARRLRHVARDAGLPIEGLSSEFFAGQFEVDLAPRDALTACDDVFLLRLLVRETVAEMGLRATFLPRPFNDRGGSGLHVNMSFFDAAGVNALDDPAAGDGLAPFAHHAIAGLLEHHVEMTALLAPTVNSYKRLRPDLMWRLLCRLGLRQPLRDDPGAAPAGCGDAAGGAPGRRERLPSPRHRDAAGDRPGRRSPRPRAATAARRGRPRRDGAATVCRSLGAALEALEASTALPDMLGRDLVDAFLAVKRHEWRRFTEHVTDWELAEYLPHH